MNKKDTTFRVASYQGSIIERDPDVSLEREYQKLDAAAY